MHACDLQNYIIIVNKSTNYIIINNTVLAESAILITNSYYPRYTHAYQPNLLSHLYRVSDPYALIIITN